METTIDEPESDTVPGLAGQNSEFDETISSPHRKNREGLCRVRRAVCVVPCVSCRVCRAVCVLSCFSRV